MLEGKVDIELDRLGCGNRVLKNSFFRCEEVRGERAQAE
jgi:hypothetical protein